MKYALVYLAATVTFFAIDMIWLGLIAKNIYRDKLGHLMAANVNWSAALIFYAIYIGGILYFAVLPGLRERSLMSALTNGAILGFLCYATYDLTNLATLKNWPPQITVVDIIWGTFLTGSVSLITCWIAKQWIF